MNSTSAEDIHIDNIRVTIKYRHFAGVFMVSILSAMTGMSDNRSISAADGDEAVNSILNGLSTPAFVTDIEGVVTNLNKQACGLFQLDAASAVGHQAGDLLGDDATATNLVQQVLQTQEDVQQLEEVIRTGDGDGVTVERTTTLLYDSAGEMVGVLELNRDVSEKVRERERKQQLEAYQDRVLEEFEMNLTRVASGDLTVDPTVPEPDDDFRAIREVYDDFVSMNEDLSQAITNTRELIESIGQLATAISGTTDELGSVSEELTASIQQLDTASVQLDDETAGQREKITAVAGNIDELSASIEEITATTNQIDTASSRAVDATNDGAATVEDAIAEITEANRAAQKNVEQVRKLETKVKEISSASELIADMAKQTNLLALNANIEAARADESGDGFAVVADEVKSLAEESQESADDIITTVEEILAEMDTTTQRIEETSDRVATGVDAARDVVETMDEIESAVEETSAGVSEIAEATTTQAQNTEQVSAAIGDIRDSITDVSGNVGAVSAGLDEQAEVADSVSQTAEMLSKKGDTLEQQIDRFDVGA